jgi:general secretion pathway protein K
MMRAHNKMMRPHNKIVHMHNYVKQALGRLWRRLQRPVITRRRRAAGVALIVVTVTIAVLGAVVGDFAFNARVDLEAAANARDSLRAEYLARSGMQLSRLLIKVQQSVIDPFRQYIGDIQIGEFAPYLVKAFGGASDERAGLGSLLGIDVSQMKGMGVGKNASFDVEMKSDDGRVNINCGGGINPNAQQAQALYGTLMALFWPPRYELPPWKIWGSPDSDGQIAERDTTARAIIDWTDVDEQQFAPTITLPGGAAPSSSGGGAEAYNYDGTRDPYRARNNYYDTLEELNLVRGVGDQFWGSFGELLTVYGGCKVNVGAIPQEKWPILAALIRFSAKDPNNPVLLDDFQLATRSQQILSLMQMTGGMAVKDVNSFIQFISDPAAAVQNLLGGAGGTQPSSSSSTQSLGIPLDNAKAQQVMSTGPRRIYRLDAVGTIERTKEKKIQVHIRGIWDTEHVNQNTISADPNDLKGTWVYWRQD